MHFITGHTSKFITITLPRSHFITKTFYHTDTSTYIFSHYHLLLCTQSGTEKLLSYHSAGSPDAPVVPGIPHGLFEACYFPPCTQEGS